MTQKELLAALHKCRNKKIHETVSIIGGNMIGMGASRSVYEVKGTDRWVLKVEIHSGMFTNACEWRNFVNSKQTPFKDWLCPCLTISENGIILIQRRAKITHLNDDMPERIPSCFTDLKAENFGYIGDRFVCVDYPYLITNTSRMKKAKFW